MRLGKKILRVLVVGGWVGLRVWQATLESACKVRLGKPTVQLNLEKLYAEYILNLLQSVAAIFKGCTLFLGTFCINCTQDLGQLWC